MPLLPPLSGPAVPALAGQTQLLNAPSPGAIPAAPQFPAQAAQPVLSGAGSPSAPAAVPLSNSGTVPVVPNQPTAPLTPTSAINQGAPANGLAGATGNQAFNGGPVSPTVGSVTVATTPTPFVTPFTASPVQAEGANPFTPPNGQAPATAAQPIITAVLGTAPIFGSVLSPLPGQSLPMLAAGPNPDITVPDANVQSNVFTMANPIRLLMLVGGVNDPNAEDYLDDFDDGALAPEESGPPLFEVNPAPAAPAPARGQEAPPPQDEADSVRLPEPLWLPASDAYFANVAAPAPAEAASDAGPGEAVLPTAGGTPTTREALTALAGAVLLGGASWQREERRDEKARRRWAEVPAGPV